MTIQHDSPSPEFQIIIPARKNSSFPNKNRYPLSGKSLIRYTFEACRGLGIPVIATTDDHYILADAESFGFQADARPARLADDHATLNDVLFYIAGKYPAQSYILLPPTAPLRTSRHIKEAVDLFRDKKADCLVSVTSERRSIWRKHDDDPDFVRPLIEVRVNRQFAEPAFITNSAIFITRREIILRNRSKFGGRTVVYKMPPHAGIDIHDKKDILLAEWYLANPSCDESISAVSTV